MSRHAFVCRTNDLRLDQVVAQNVPTLSRRRARALIAQGSVSVNGARHKKLGTVIPPGSKVEVYDVDLANVANVGDAAGPADAPLALSILGCFPDGADPRRADVVVVNKAAGVATEPTKQSSRSVTDSLFAERGRKGPPLAAVHRLDVDTSGVLVVAVPDAVAPWAARFADGSAERRYLAIAACPAGGWPLAPAGVIDAPLTPPENGPTGRGRVRVDDSGKPARTRYAVIASAPGGETVALWLWAETGRTHQLRAHLAHVGAPLFGDRRYGDLERARACPHLGLHAWFLSLTVDDAVGSRTFIAPPPPTFFALADACDLRAPIEAAIADAADASKVTP